MPNAHGRKVDTTHLSWATTAERLLFHRDTQAHFLRWSHVLKHLQKLRGKCHVIELGCGKELPLPCLLYSNRCVPLSYTAVDYRKLELPEMLTKPVESGKFDLTILDQTDAATVTSDGKYDVVVSLECIEHVEPGHTRKILQTALTLIEPTEGTFFLSTPCYDAQVGAADNHVSEITYEALGALLEDLGWRVKSVWGTFASIKDYESEIPKRFGADGVTIFNLLRAYYDTNVLANVFAPLFPAQSRNCLWELTTAPLIHERKFPPLCEVEGPWTSSAEWRQLAGDEA